jgi:hypothetical protein
MDAEDLKDHVKDRWPRLYRTARALRRKPGEIAQRLLEANYSLFRLAKKTTAFRAERNRTEAVVGYRPGLHRPTTINEKILWKKLHNRNPLLPVTADKLTVREFVRDRLEPETAGELVVPVLETAGAPEDLSLGRHDLPVVVKANHGSGLNLFIHNRRADGSFIAAEEHAPRSRWTPGDVADRCREWLRTAYGFYRHEWAYQEIDRRLFVEPLITDPFGSQLTDIKFDCFHGRPIYVLLQVHTDNESRCTLLDNGGQSIPARHEEKREVPDRIVATLRPLVDRLRPVAARLSAPFDYCRVDFYATNDGPRFSEITHYPSSGRRAVSPPAFDRTMARHWTLDRSKGSA